MRQRIFQFNFLHLSTPVKGSYRNLPPPSTRTVSLPRQKRQPASQREPSRPVMPGQCPEQSRRQMPVGSGRAQAGVGRPERGGPGQGPGRGSGSQPADVKKRPVFPRRPPGSLQPRQFTAWKHQFEFEFNPNSLVNMNSSTQKLFLTNWNIYCMLNEDNLL